MTVSITHSVTLLAFLLALVRAAGWVIVSPPFTSTPMPLMVRSAICVALAMMGYTHLPASEVPTDIFPLIGALLANFFTGAAMGMVFRLLFMAFETGGAFIDMFGGINLPPALDPLSENQVQLLGQIYYLVAMALLYISGGYLMLVHGWVLSFRTVFTIDSFSTISSVLTRDLSTYFVASLELAAPLLIVLFAAQVVLGLIAKAAPQANVFLLAFPFQVLLTLAVVGIGIRVLPTSVDTTVSHAIVQGARALGL